MECGSMFFFRRVYETHHPKTGAGRGSSTIQHSYRGTPSTSKRRECPSLSNTRRDIAGASVSPTPTHGPGETVTPNQETSFCTPPHPLPFLTACLGSKRPSPGHVRHHSTTGQLLPRFQLKPEQRNSLCRRLVDANLPHIPQKCAQLFLGPPTQGQGQAQPPQTWFPGCLIRITRTG